MKRSFHDGEQDGLAPLESVDLDRVESFSDLLEAMRKTAFGGRRLGEALDVLSTAARDDDCLVVLTVSGAMTVAKQGKIICDLIDRGVVDAVVATGALIAHGLTESIGCVHYAHDPKTSDEELFAQGYNRVYDTLEMESNLNDVERLVRTVLNEDSTDSQPWSSVRLCRAIGKRLDEEAKGPAILRSAFRRDVPVFIPAFTDSELGLDVAAWQVRREWESRALDPDDATWQDLLTSSSPNFNPFIDLQEYAKTIAAAPRLAILTIGGGVPRNWAQQVGPFFDVINSRMGTSLQPPRFQYAVRICPEPVHWGGLSGCSYSEGVSWGKFVSPNEGGRFAEVFADATLVLPLLIKALFEQLDANEASN